MKIYFSDFFEVLPALLEEYGAFNISLLNDLPLFIDPFLLFNSDLIPFLVALKSRAYAAVFNFIAGVIR